MSIDINRMAWWPAIPRLLHVGFWSTLTIYLAHINRLSPLGGDGWYQTIMVTMIGATRHYIRSYLKANPRIGEFFSVLGYKEEWLGILINSGTVLLFVLLMFIFAFRRLPSWRRVDDFFRLSIILALLWLFLPQVGLMFFFRPFNANYLLGFSLLMAFLSPYILKLQWQWKPWLAIPPAFAGGFIAGLTNEQTVPPVLFMLGSWLFFSRKKPGYSQPWQWSGLIGLAAGYAALFFAPGQGKRYGGEGQHLFDNIGEKLADIPVLLGHLWELSGYAGMFLVFFTLISLFWYQRYSDTRARELQEPLVLSLIYLATAHMMVVLLSISPRQGDKLFVASVALMLAALLMLGDYWLRKKQFLLAGVGVLSLVVSFHFMELVHGKYHFYNKEFRKRVTQIERQKARGKQVIYIRPYKTHHDRLIWGDDRGRIRRGMPSMAIYFGVEKITYAKRRRSKGKK